MPQQLEIARKELKPFAHEYGFEKAYGSYEEMLADPQVDLVYLQPHMHSTLI